MPLPGSKNHELDLKLSTMRLTLAPLVQLTTGLAHPLFPPTLLHYWLLTDELLDDFASFYHQSSPSPWTHQYPKSMNWRKGLTLEEKRSKMGKFIGLRGCEAPVVENSMDFGMLIRTPKSGDSADGSDGVLAEKSEEEIWEEARRAREQSNEIEAAMWRKKM